MEARRVWFAARWVLAWMLVAVFSLAATAEDPASARLHERIQGLIAELGAKPFATRERAQAELLRIGLPAFDALYDAQTHSDLEIALRARFLVGTLRIAWTQENDTAEVKKILRGYEERNREDRETLIKQLAELEGGLGWPALCRVIRFERSEELSKRAALLLMQAAHPTEPAAREQLAARLSQGVAQSRRAAAQWIRTLAQTLHQVEPTLAAWDALVRAEQETFARDSTKTSRTIVRDLLRWQADLLTRVGRGDEAAGVVARTLELVEGSRQDLLEAIDWLMKRGAWEQVDRVGQRYQAEFAADATLLYRLAESRLKQGRRAEAEQAAELALGINPEDAKTHTEQAFSLQERGLFAWAEKEYRLALTHSPLGSIFDLRARFLLSEMLWDIERPLAAAQVLQEIADGMDKDPAIADMIERLGRSSGSVISRMHYFYAKQAEADGAWDKVRERLSQATESDPTDADALIARYRFPNPPPEWHRQTLEMITSAATMFAQQAEQYERQLGSNDDAANRDYFGRQAAQELNQFAWLVGNTEGDFDAAVRASHRSNELRPDSAGYLDTLGRCYYARKDYANAVKYQTQALKLEPHSGQMRRQLELFQRALDESRRAQPPAPEK